MGNSFRNQPAPALYPDDKTPFAADVLEVGLAVACGMIAFSFLLILPGIRGWERLWATVRVLVALWVGVILLECNFGYAWLEDEIKDVHTQYKAFANFEITADIGLHIGLRGVNITLKGAPEYQYNERINYNEAYRWTWAQGRAGFGPNAGRFNQEFRASQFRGVPYPIQWIAEYLTLDGEQIRWGRRFRVAGWYTHILLWLAFAVYLITMILFWLVIRYGAISMIWLGVLMILAIFFFGIITINDPELLIPFGPGEDNTIDPHFGWSFYLCMLTGIGCVFCGCLIWFMDYFFPREIAKVFNHSLIEDDEFFQEEEPEPEQPTLEEYGVSTRGVRKTQRGLTRYRQTQRKPRSTLRSTRGGSQRLKEAAIPLEDLPQGPGPVSITVSTKA
ncbi:dual oxidase maturation factor 1-like isoform X2 [Dysidea avara]|uniref:dual oxidase maturation factor 1-like isoform X2 n=1 Tax=Dysidea avara TaxID=196820 RepID=UPI00332A5427